MTRQASAKYLLRGGPKDGELVDAPPGFLHEIADGIVGAVGGRIAGLPRVAGDGWVDEFSPDEAGVLIGREATESELEMEVEQLGHEHGARPEEIPDERWEALP